VGGTITLTDALPLDAQGYTSITIGFSYEWLNGSTTRFLDIQYAANGTTFTTLARVTSGNGGTGGTPGFLSITLLEGTDHTISGSGTIQNTSFLPSFADTAKFRFVDNAAAAADVRVFVDDITLTGSPTYVPEPRAALLGGLGMLALLRRRR
jgi:MYXO-CTERM domain-containing protein